MKAVYEFIVIHTAMETNSFVPQRLDTKQTSLHHKHDTKIKKSAQSLFNLIFGLKLDVALLH